MSRDVNALLLAYMQGTNARSMTKIVKIGPFQDASFRYLTQTIRNIVYDDGDGEQTYIGRTGMQMSTFVSTDSLGVDNAEMDTLPIVQGWPLEGFTQDQVLSGELDGIDYVVYSLDWQRLDLGHFIFSKGRLGETRIKGTALFTFEQRSISNRLKQVIGQLDSISCRADFGSVNYGEATDGEREELYPCEYPLALEWEDFEVSSVHPTDDDLEFNATDLGGFEDFRFAPGLVRWLTGANANTENEVGDFTSDAGEGSVVLAFHSRYTIAPGDTGQIRRSCTFRPHGHNSCADTFWKELWVLHYRGEPYIPIGDAAGNLVSGAAVAGDVGGTGEFLPPVPGPPPPDPDEGGGDSAGTPTERTIGATVVTPSLTSGEAGAGANSTAVNAAFSGLPGDGGTVRIPAGGPWYIDTSNPITPVNNSRLDLATNSATLLALGSNTHTAPSTHRDIVRVDGVHEVEIIGGAMTGYRDYWTANGGVAAFGVSEWAHGIYLTGGSYNVTIADISLNKFVGDGISIGRSTHDIHVSNIISTRNRRQGISTGGDDILIEFAECSYIGLDDGTAPKAGIDIEVDLPDTNSATNVTIRNCHLHHNAGPGLIAWRSCDGIEAEGNIVEYNTYGVLLNESSGTRVQGNTIRHNKYWGIRAQSGTEGYTFGGAAALKNVFWNNRTSVHGVDTSAGSTTQVDGQSTFTADHIRIESDSSATVLTNDVIS